jgi:hypothetical protein
LSVGYWNQIRLAQSDPIKWRLLYKINQDNFNLSFIEILNYSPEFAHQSTILGFTIFIKNNFRKFTWGDSYGIHFVPTPTPTPTPSMCIYDS